MESTSNRPDSPEPKMDLTVVKRHKHARSQPVRMTGSDPIATRRRRDRSEGQRAMFIGGILVGLGVVGFLLLWIANLSDPYAIFPTGVAIFGVLTFLNGKLQYNNTQVSPIRNRRGNAQGDDSVWLFQTMMMDSASHSSTDASFSTGDYPPTQVL